MSRTWIRKIPATLITVLLFAPLLWSQSRSRISVYFTVEDGDKLIGGLTEKNFRLYEDGQPRSFRLAEPESPILFSLLAEYSQISGFYLSDIEQALRGFMDVAPDGHWYSLATYSHGLTIRVDYTRQKAKVLAAYAELGQPTWSEVDTYDAVYEMLEKLELLPGRKVLIVIGSGVDTFSSRTLDAVQKKIESVNLTVFGIGAGSMLRGQYDAYLAAGTKMELLQAEAFFNMLAKRSGGQAFFPAFESAYRDVMEGVVQMLQHQYRIVYDSEIPFDRKFHRLKLDAYQTLGDKRREYTVRIREGWRKN